MTPAELEALRASGNPFALGYAPESPNGKDYTFDPSLPRALPSYIAPSFQKVPVYSQQGGTCVGNSIAAALSHLVYQDGGAVVGFDGEELNARITHAFDQPTSFRPVMDSILATGIRPRNGHGLYFVQGYANVDYTDVEAMKAAIAVDHQMMVIATHLEPGFGDDRKGYQPANPTDNSGGLHAMCVVAYDDHGVLIQNNWDTWFCDGGFVRLAWDYVARHFVEAMVITDKADAAGGYVKTYQPPVEGQPAIRKIGTTAVYQVRVDGRFWIKDPIEAKRMGVDLRLVQDVPATDKRWALPVIGLDAPASAR